MLRNLLMGAGALTLLSSAAVAQPAPDQQVVVQAHPAEHVTAHVVRGGAIGVGVGAAIGCLVTLPVCGPGAAVGAAIGGGTGMVAGAANAHPDRYYYRERTEPAPGY